MVTRIESTLESRRDASSFPTHIQRIALLVFLDMYQTAIARQSTTRFRSHRRAILKLTLTGFLALEGFLRNVNDNLMLVTAGHRFSAMLQETFSY